MSSYLIDKFKGKYSLQAEIDKSTGDFCRDKNGNLENYNDIWIECYGKGRVFHYGKNVLTYYCESKQRGKNIITAINELDKDLIFDIEETDSEVLFKFKANNIEKIEQFIKPKTTSADRSPFSVKNIRKKLGVKKYSIPNEDLAEYKEITSLISKEDLSVYNKINNGFLSVLCAKKHQDIDDLKSEIKLSGLKLKEYLHQSGHKNWRDYLDYTKNYLKENL